MSIFPLSKEPQPDEAEFNAFFPSKLSLSRFTSSKSDLDGASYPQPYRGSRRILLIGTDERYLAMANGTLFSTGNHPVETLLPMYHLHKAGFEFDIATVSGNAMKFEFWAMPKDDAEVTGLHAAYLEKFRQPLKLADVAARLGPDSDYVAVFIPGGHGPLVGLPFSADMAAVLRWAFEADRYVISICHGPAAFLACANDGGSFPFEGYAIVAFPDEVDRQTPDIGYMPGQLTWHFGEKLKALGVTILNEKPSGATHRDRKLLTGDSPFAGNELGKLAAKTLLEAVAGEQARA